MTSAGHSSAGHDPEPNGGAESRQQTAGPPAPVRRWQGQLLDLTMRNPLINLGETGVPLFVDESSLAAIENVVAQGVPVTVRGAEDLDELEVHDSAHGVHDLDPATLLEALDEGGLVFAQIATRQLRTALADLGRRAKLAHEELGASALYLSLGALRITNDAGTEALAPLLLLPITLTGPRLGPHVIRLEPGASVRANECLLEWLRRASGFEPEVLRNPPLADPGVDVPRLLAGLREQLADRELPFEVVPDARIALLRFSTMQLWRDVHDNWQTFCDNPLVRHLVEGEGAAFTESTDKTKATEVTGAPTVTDTEETDLSLPLPADGSQIEAVTWAAAGRTFVLEGPPGTGKSQTIANVIAHALHSGERVLFVAEKQAALDVVARRLRQVGLGGACLALHGKEQTSRAVRAHLRASSESLPGGAERSEDRSGEDRSGEEHEGEGIEALEQRRRTAVERLAAYPRELREAGPDELVGVDTVQRTASVLEYRQATARYRQALRIQIAQSVARRAHEAEGTEPGEAMRALGHEVRTAHASGLAELVSEHIDAILRVTPCLLMSPSTVAQYLPARPGMFDLVVFDESSQIRVSSAIGGLGRARAAVIVGDAQQMPPSELFTVGASDETEADGGEQESILLEAHRAGVPSLRLDRHYRSRSEGLVSFSNRHYYDGGLATFPTPPGSQRDSGVEIRRVPGSFEQGRGGRKLNIIEANAVIDEVRAVLEAQPEASVGVITFNSSQAEYIAEKLDSDASEQVRAALDRDDEPLFVKNLENVQGDERDYVFFSLTYSLGVDGRLPTNFGLLARRGGERRLNVALTRARVRNVLFASFDPTDIADSGEASRGPEHLREYMQAAQSGELMVTGVDEVAPDEYREDVARRLREAGAEVVESVGLSSFRVDVAVRLPEATGTTGASEGRWVAVQLDSAEWAGRSAVVDRDALPEAVLVDGMGWAAFTQLYRSAWANDPDSQVARILDLCRGVSAQVTPLIGDSEADAVEPPEMIAAELPESLGEILASMSTDGEKVVLPPDVAKAVAEQAAAVRRLAENVSAGEATEGPHAVGTDEPGADGISADAASTDAARDARTVRLSAFVPASETQRADRSVIQSLPDPAAVAQVEAQWRDVVAAEGPVHVDRAMRIVAQRFGWRHLMPHRRGAITDALPGDVHRERAVWQGDTFLWPTGTSPHTYREVRGGSRADRKIAEIAPQERANAIRLVLAESGGRCSEGDLVRGVNEVFGFGWLGGMSRGQLRGDLAPLAEAGEVRLDAGDVMLVTVAEHAR